MTTFRTSQESQILDALTAARSTAEAEYEQDRKHLALQGITKEQYVRSRLQDADLPQAFAEPLSYDDLVAALADGKRVDPQRMAGIMKMEGRTEAELRSAVVNR